jgi:transposase
MKPHPLELQERIVKAVDDQYGTIAEIAEMFNVSERYVFKLLQLRAERGDLSPLPHGGGARSKLSEEQKLKVVDFVAAKPDVTIGELRQEIKKKLRVELSVGAVWNVLDALGLTRKKSLAAHAKPTRKSAPLSRRDSRGSRADD